MLVEKLRANVWVRLSHVVYALFQRIPRPGKRVRTPTRIQMEAVECGAACLAIVLEYHGLAMPLEAVRTACGVSRDGSRAKNMLIAARQYGLKAQGYKRSIKRLHECRFPAIIFWNFNHFVVLEGFGNGKVYLNDPARGRCTVTDEEFDTSFTGVVLELEPSPTFQRANSKPSLFTGLRSRLIGSSGALMFVILTSLWVTLLGLVAPSFTRIFVDYVLMAGLTDWIVPLCVFMLATAASVASLVALQQHFLLRLETKLSIAASSQFLWHVLKLPMDFFNQRRAADISVRVQINDRIARLLSGEVATNLIRLLLIVFYTVVMIQYDVVLTVLSVAMAILNMIALRAISRVRSDISQRLLTEQGKFTSVALNGLQSIETLKATGTESDFFSRWAGHQAQSLSAEQDLSVYTEVLTALPTALLTITNALVLAVGGIRVISGQISMGELVAFQALAVAFLVPVNGIVFLADRLQLTAGDMTRVDDVMRYPLADDAQSMTLDATRTQATQSAESATKLMGLLEIKNLTFGYSKLDPPLIEGFELSLKPGSRVALVGGSGSGKSTIAKLVAGVYEPWSGEILFDGQTRAELPRAHIKNSLAMVDQDIYLLEGSIRDNIVMWDNTIAESHVIQAAKDAAIHDDISQR